MFASASDRMARDSQEVQAYAECEGLAIKVSYTYLDCTSNSEIDKYSVAAPGATF